MKGQGAGSGGVRYLYSSLRAPGSVESGGLAVSRERRLGRGLEALLGRAWDEPQPPAPISADEITGDDRLSRDENGQMWLNCDAIARNPYQPRQTFDEAE